MAEYVPASESPIDSTTITKVIKDGDARDLLSLKKALDRDIAIIKGKIIDEEEKISEYTVLLSFVFMEMLMLEEYVMRRRNDYSGFVKCMLRKLAERDLIRPLLS